MIYPILYFWLASRLHPCPCLGLSTLSHPDPYHRSLTSLTPLHTLWAPTWKAPLPPPLLPLHNGPSRPLPWYILAFSSLPLNTFYPLPSPPQTPPTLRNIPWSSLCLCLLGDPRPQLQSVSLIAKMPMAPTRPCVLRAQYSVS